MSDAQDQDKSIKVLIPYDGSESAETALDDLRRAGLPQALDAHRSSDECVATFVAIRNYPCCQRSSNEGSNCRSVFVCPSVKGS